ncbi:hypothetical protein ACFWN2_18545 [Lentzea sp. NPDC058436]|uniref:hypothetical protein n=1 Tax=Lentzea sp. NPDC058436 TaxID=3346499 RepID=UPI003659CFFA
MIDRRRVALVLVVLGAALAVVASFQRVFSTVYSGFGSGLTITTTLWVTRSVPVNGPPEQPAFFAAGLPVVISSLVMVVAVVVMSRERSAFVGQALAMGGAGLLAGVVLFYVLQVRSLEGRLTADASGPQEELHYHGGIYLLGLAAIIGLVGAGLAQRRVVAPVEETAEVVVHQVGGDDDTPPFGIAIPPDGQQETR